MRLRLLFAAEPDDEQRVRSLVTAALARGWGDDPEGVRTTWRLVSSGPSEVRPEEAEHVARLIRLRNLADPHPGSGVRPASRPTYSGRGAEAVTDGVDVRFDP